MKYLFTLLTALCLTFTGFCQNYLFKTNAGTFDKNVYMIITPDTCAARAVTLALLESDEGVDFECAAFTISYGGDIVIWMPELPRTAEQYGTVNHELLHAVTFILEWAELPFSPETEELYSAEIDYLTRNFYIQIFKEYVNPKPDASLN